MKKLIVFLGLFLSVTALFAQIEKPVHWSFSSEKINDTEANVLLTATIDAGWHIYSLKKVDGPIPTSFEFNKSEDYSLIGKVREPKAHSAFDPNFGVQIEWHSTKATFKQRIKFNKPGAVVSGTLEFMVCNDKQCLPPDNIEFKIALDGAAAGKPANAQDVNPGSITSIAPPGTVNIAVGSKNAGDNSVKASPGISSAGNIGGSSGSLWSIFIAGFIGGLAAFFMPCIYPMIPLTISYFTKKSGSRAKTIQSALTYGLSIILIYLALGLLVTFLFGASALNEAASSATFNLLFFAILVIFAISFLGAFEITLPSSLVNKADERSNSGGLIGLFFMAFTLALVSFSCTGPIIGYLLVDSVSNGAYLGPAAGMFGFSLALAIPFTLFAIFPSWLKGLPRSGGWLNTVKVSLGFLELALALKFLSNVDLAYHWQVFDRGIFLVIWIVIFGMLGLYLLGKIRFSHDSGISFLSLPRLFFAMFVLAFTIYMIPGLWGAPLNAISAWLPPPSVRDFNLSAGPSENVKETPGKKYTNLFHAEHEID
ncbi:MAG: Protein-disulfide reductase, partial [Chitinophagaceae bacterium]|nr:Protein-disulfide reductase [Chitinophagaceae bacterium]